MSFPNLREEGRPIAVLEDGLQITPNVDTLNFESGVDAQTNPFGSDSVEVNADPAGIDINDLSGVLEIAKGGTNNTTFTDRSILWFDGATQKIVEDNVNLYYDPVYEKVVSSGFDLVAAAIAFFVNYTTGNDANDGLTISTPFKTIQKAIETIPILFPGVCTINLSADNHILTAALTMPESLAKSGNSDKAVVIKFVGASKATTTITAASNSTNIFNCFSKNVLIDFDKVTLSGGARQINCDGGATFVRDVEFLNFFTAGWTVTNNATAATVAGSPTTVFTNAPTSTAANGIAVSAFSRFSQNTHLQFNNVRGTAGTAINISANGAFARFSAGSITVTTDAALPPRFILAFAAGSAVTIGGGAATTVSITGPIFAGVVSKGGIRTLGGNIVIVTGTNMVITNCEKGLSIDGPTSWISSAVPWTFTGCAIPVEIAEGALVADTNKFSGAAITYVESIIPTAVDSILVGYDNRFARAMKRTAVADANYTYLVTDRMVAYTSLTAPRTVTLPAIATLTANNPANVPREIVIKDESGNCSAANPITITGVNIDGAASYIMNLPYGSVTLYAILGGSQYFTK